MGSLTQWISMCRCGLLDTQTTQEKVTICAACGKRIVVGNAGSFTQWVFRSQTCDCQNPVPVDALSTPDRIEDQIADDEDSKADVAAGPADLKPENFPLERYKPIRPLGAGAGGSVYLCWDERLMKHVSVKVLLHRSNANLVAFQREARVTARFQHPNVVSIIDFGATASGSPYMVLEYVNGISLDAVIRYEGAIPEELAIGLFIQVADALQHGHEAKIFHRDVKSSNILVLRPTGADDPGTIRIIDFGVSTLLGNEQESTAFQGRTVVGTPKYMAPDQALGHSYDARSEIYSFGCVMYEVLLGTVPFDADNAIDLLSKHTNQAPPAFEDVRDDLEISYSMQSIVLKCLEKDPDARFQDMQSLKVALQDLKADDSRAGSLDEEERVLSPAAKSKWMLVGILISVASLIPVVPIVYSGFTKEESPEEVKSQVKKEEANYRVRDRIELPNLEEGYISKQDKFDFLKLETGYIQAKAKAKAFVTDEDLAVLKGRKDITALNIHRTEVRGPGLEYVLDVPIQSLDMNEAPIDDKALDIVAKMKDVNMICMQGCLITDEGLKKITKMRLGYIGLNKTDITANSLKILSKCQTIETIEMLQAPKIDAKALEELRRFPHLKKVFVSTDDKPTEFFQTLGSLKLQTILLWGLKMISAKNLSYLDSRTLGFHATKFSGPQFAALRSLKKLRRLEFWSCDINDAQMDEICRLPVEVLSISDEPRISADGYRRLVKMKTLKVLQLPSNTRLIRQALNDLQKARPDIRFEYPEMPGFSET